MSELPSKTQIPKLAPNSFWGLLWIVSSIIAPAIAGAVAVGMQSEPPEFVFWGVPAFVLIMHTTASTMICRHSLGLGILAFFFGWILIAGSFFIGCCANFSL